MEVRLELEKLISHYMNLIAYTQSLPYEELRQRAIKLLALEVRKLKKRR